MHLLNLGCGNRFDRSWTNVDLSPVASNILRHDLRKALPFSDNSFDGIYLSHVLEHFDNSSGLRLLVECHRLCVTSGIIRVAVPDLEGIARLYLSSMEKAIGGSESASPQYDWMILELYDQAVRVKPRGQMAAFVARSTPDTADFIRERIGADQYRALTMRSETREDLLARITKVIADPRILAYRARGLATTLFMSLVWGSRGPRMAQEALFREQGEVHRWMYDRFSLSRALQTAGFGRIRVCQANESQINNWSHYCLDVDAAGHAIKPDSLYCEGVKV